MNDDGLRAAYNLWLASASVEEVPFPELETLERYRQRKLCPEERELVTKALCRYPELARLLSTDWHPPDPGHIDVFDEEMVARSWSDFQAQLLRVDAGGAASFTKSTSEDLPAGGDNVPSAEANENHREGSEGRRDSAEVIRPEGAARSTSPGARPPLGEPLLAVGPAGLVSLAGRRRKVLAFWRRVSLAACLLAVIICWLYINSWQEFARLESSLLEPKAAPQHRELAPDGFEHSGQAVVEDSLPLGAVSELLILNLRGLPQNPAYTVHLLKLDGAGEKLVWSADGLVPRPDDTIEFWFPAQFWGSGRYRFDLYAMNSIEEKPLASFSLGTALSSNERKVAF
ncbi:MAG: hypothetical protein SX243_06320 [Acidobacteriota bacterium]|nr:hypothetical protein [Acidobacteriota bacterium]